MESAPVPPLFCSTPPPIDFDDEDIDDNEFAIATDIDESKSTAATPTSEFAALDTARLEDCCYIPSSSPPPFDLTAEEPPSPDDNANIVEAINVDSIHKYEESLAPSSPPVAPPVAERPNSPVASESLSASSTCPSDKDKPQEAPWVERSSDARHKREAFCGLISVEDVSDESDSEHLRNGCGSLSLEEDDPNFYRIEVVDAKATASPPTKEWEREKVDPPSPPREEDVKNAFASMNLDDAKEFEVPPETLCSLDSFDDDSEWGDVQFSSASAPEVATQTPDIEPPAAATTMTISDVCFDKAFATPEAANESPPRDIDDSGGDDRVAEGGDHERVARGDDQDRDGDDRDREGDDQGRVEDGDDRAPALNEDDDDDDFDDDEFGDFAAASAFETPAQKAPAPAQQQITQSPPTESIENCSNLENAAAPEPNLFQATKLSLEQVKPLLASIFPVAESSSEESENIGQKPPNRLPMESVDSASALNYQWKHSETRTCLIRSLGIDSRNILYAEKWNPSMPRFAANLSFDPIQPLKPQTSGAEVSAEPAIQMPLKPQVTTDLKETIPMDSLADKLSETSLNPSQSIPAERLEPLPAASASPVVMEDIHLDTPKIPAKLANAVDSNYLPFDEPSPFEAVAAYQQPPSHLDLGAKTLSMPADEYAAAPGDGDMVTTPTTFSVPLKETHIFTPSKHDETIAVTLSAPSTLASPPKAEPIDFDYEKAAAGIIIDETVVKKEYRDIEYNPGFSLELSNGPTAMTTEVVTTAAAMFSVVDEVAAVFETPTLDVAPSAMKPVIDDLPAPPPSQPIDLEDEFCEFQSVPPPPSAQPAAKPASDEMILCPSILLPKALSMDPAAKPKVEWGDSVANINPDELARIEELFSQSNRNGASSAAVAVQQQPQQQAPHLQPRPQQSPTISGRVARKEQTNTVPTDEDDDWSDFLSVPASNVNTMPKMVAARPPPTSATLGRVGKLPNLPPPPQMGKTNASPVAADDEWSDFVSSNTANGQQFYGASNNNNNNTNKYLQNKTHHIVHDFSTFPAPQQHQQHHHNHHHQHHHNHSANQSISFHNPSAGKSAGHHAASMPRKLMPNISVIPTLGFSNIMASKSAAYTTKK